MPFPPLSFDEAKNISRENRFLIGESIISGNLIGTIETIAVSPYDDMKKIRFISNYSGNAFNYFTIELDEEIHFDVVIIARSIDQKVFFYDFRKYLVEKKLSFLAVC